MRINQDNISLMFFFLFMGGEVNSQEVLQGIVYSAKDSRLTTEIFRNEANLILHSSAFCSNNVEVAYAGVLPFLYLYEN